MAVTMSGDMRVIHSYFQLVVATTKDLDDEVETGRMLADFKVSYKWC